MAVQQVPGIISIPGWMNFVIGGCSGMMSTCIVQPLDMIKTRMQLMGPAGMNATAWTVASDLVRREGVLGLYKGLSAGLFRQATYGTGRLGCYNAASDFYKNSSGTAPNFGVKMLLGISAGAVGAFVGTPAEVALIRIMADGRVPEAQRRNYTHVFNALGRIVKEEGVRTLWRGAVPTITRAMVVNGAQLATYAQAREMLLPAMGNGMPLHITASMFAGFVTSVASLPVDIVKTRVQNAAKGSSQGQVFMNIIRNEGVLALWSGFLPTLSKIGPHTVLTFIFMEQLNNIYFKSIATKI